MRNYSGDTFVYNQIHEKAPKRRQKRNLPPCVDVDGPSPV